MEDSEPAVEAHVRETFPALLAAIEDAVARATADWPAGGVHDGSRARAAIHAALETSGIRPRLLAVLESVLSELDTSPPAPPVAAPPYVVATSEGVLLRATLDDTRLVLTLQVVTHADGTYRPLGDVRVAARLV